MLFFLATGYATRLYHAKQRALAQDWVERGEAARQTAQAERALADYRNALSYAPENTIFQLRLAQALADAGRVDEARSYLLNLREHAPGSGPVNRELARLAAGVGQVPAAIDYYHDAIYGAWDQDPQRQRLQTRLELCQFLLARGAAHQAQVELAALAANLPPSEQALRSRVAGLFLQAQDPSQALREFQTVLAADPSQAEALSGAGRAAFLLGQYRSAEQYLARAVRKDPKNAQAAELMAQAQLVLASDPFEVGLTDQERARRVVAAFDHATGELQLCGAPQEQGTQPASWQIELAKAREVADALRRTVHSRALPRHPEEMMQAMNLVYRLEQLKQRACGPLTDADQALLLIAARHPGMEP